MDFSCGELSSVVIYLLEDTNEMLYWCIFFNGKGYFLFTRRIERKLDEAVAKVRPSLKLKTIVQELRELENNYY